MRISLQVQYALCGLFDLAYNGGERPVRLRILGERQGIPLRYLEQIFQRLRRAKLVEGKRGPGGGYRLARPPAQITLRDVVEAIEGPAERWFDPTGPWAERPNPYRPSFLWHGLGRELGEALAGTTLDSLCREAAKRGVRHAGSEPEMYFI